MKEIIKLGVVLLVVCMIAAFALSMTNEVTKDKILENTIIANRQARQEVYSDADDFVLIASSDESATYDAHPASVDYMAQHPEVVEVYQAMANGEHVGFVIKTEPKGYGGALEVVVGFSLDGTLQGVRVGNHQETPGLGAKAKTEDFYNQYNGLSVQSAVDVVKVDITSGNNEIKAISGATITSKAVTQGVNYGLSVIETFK